MTYGRWNLMQGVLMVLLACFPYTTAAQTETKEWNFDGERPDTIASGFTNEVGAMENRG
jgi:hypothetical protein